MAIPQMSFPQSPAPVLTPSQVTQIPSRSLPIASQLNHVLQEFTSLSYNLFSTLSSSSTFPASVAPILSALAVVDQKLVGVLELVVEHQRLQRRVERLISQLQSTDGQWRNGTRALHEAIKSLDPIIASGKIDRALIADSAKAADTLDPSTILSYARSLAPFTSAPPSSLFPPEQKISGGTMDPSGRSLPVGAIPPFPTEGIMRRGRLQFGRAGEEGMGETDEVGVRKEAKEEEKPKAMLPSERLLAQAKQVEAPTDDFTFDLDLNPDM